MLYVLLNRITCTRDNFDLFGMPYLTGVAVQIQKDYTHILYVYCLAHCLNLCLQDCRHNKIFIRDALNITAELNNIICAETGFIPESKDKLSLQSLGQKPLCTTRWTIRTGVLDATIRITMLQYLELEEIARTSTGEEPCEESGLLALLEKFSTYFGLRLSHQIFAITEQLSSNIMHKRSLCSFSNNSILTRWHSDDGFNNFHSLITKESKNLIEPLILPRQIQVPTRYDSGFRTHIFDPECSKYFEVYDPVCNELKRRNHLIFYKR